MATLMIFILLMVPRHRFSAVRPTDQNGCSTMFGSSYFSIVHRRKEESMASIMHCQRRITSWAWISSGVLGVGLLGLLLTAPLSWAQTPPPPTPPPTDIIILQVDIIAPESGEVVNSDCFRLDPTTATFTSDFFSAQGAPNGFWNAVSVQEGQPSLFTAHITALGASSDGQPVAFTVSYGGVLDFVGQFGGLGPIIQSDGTPYVYQAQINPNCSVPPPGLSAQGNAPSSPLEALRRGYGD